MKALLLILFLFSLSHDALFSQNTDEKQLLLKLEKSKDTVRVNVLNELTSVFNGIRELKQCFSVVLKQSGATKGQSRSHKHL